MNEEDEEFNRIEREAAMRKEAVRATMNKPRIDQGPDYERGFIDGMQHQMKSSVDKAVNAMSTPPECQTEAEKTAFAFGWWKALEANRAPVQEPVAYVVTTEVHGQMCSFIHRSDLTKLLPDGAKLYTTPPAQRQWVGLTAEDCKEIERQSIYVEGAIRLTEDKLKEKNT